MHGRQLGLQAQLGQANDAVHGRAYLVAHVGQEVAFGCTGSLGLGLGARQGGQLFALGGHIGHGAQHAQRAAVGRPR